MSDDDIPVLTDMIEEKVDATQPEIGLDIDQDMYIDEDEDIFPILNLENEEPTPPSSITDPVAINPALEQTIRRILDEHMELAWQEIRLAIQEEQESNH